jgi:hypothetical protein
MAGFTVIFILCVLSALCGEFVQKVPLPACLRC